MQTYTFEVRSIRGEGDETLFGVFVISRNLKSHEYKLEPKSPIKIVSPTRKWGFNIGDILTLISVLFKWLPKNKGKIDEKIKKLEYIGKIHTLIREARDEKHAEVKDYILDELKELDPKVMELYSEKKSTSNRKE